MGLGLGHVISPLAREVWLLVFLKYYRYIKILFGAWDNRIYQSYDFSSTRDWDLDNLENLDPDLIAEKRRDFSTEMSSIVSTRALVAMFAVPQLGPLAVYAIGTSSCPPCVFSFECVSRLPRGFARDALKVAVAREKRRIGEKGNFHESKNLWVAHVKKYRVFMELSRYIQYIKELFSVIQSIAFMYSRDLNTLIIASLVFFIPYIFFSILDVIVIIGNVFKITDDDLKLICINVQLPDNLKENIKSKTKNVEREDGKVVENPIIQSITELVTMRSAK